MKEFINHILTLKTKQTNKFREKGKLFFIVECQLIIATERCGSKNHYFATNIVRINLGVAWVAQSAS